MAGEILRRRLEIVLARGQEQRAVAGARDGRAEVKAAFDRGLLAENHFHVGELRLAALFEKAGACERSAIRIGRARGPARLGEAEIDDAALFEIGREHDVEQAAPADRGDRGHAFDRRRQFSVMIENAEPPRTLGHEHAAVRQKGERPGMVESACHGLNAERHLFAFDAVVRFLRGSRRDKERKKNREKNYAGAHLPKVAAYATRTSLLAAM